jgi:serine/threonine-protein kinase
MPNPFDIVFNPRLLTIGALGWLTLAGCATTDQQAEENITDPTPAAAAGSGEGAGDTEATEEGAGGSAASALQAASMPGKLFKNPQPWTKDVSALEKSGASDDIIGWLADHGGWGTPRLRIEFSIKVLTADASTPFRAFTPTDDFYSPDCDHVPFPLPKGGAIEDEDGYTCTTDGDCHLLVVHPSSGKLYEMWRANIDDKGFHGGCAAVWDLNKSYTQGRGDNCTSADAGGFPVSAMVFTADEVAKGSIDHAIRFILPNSRIRRGVFVPPATHASDALHGGANAPPYGVRLRLRRDFPLQSLPTEGARVVARALQRYGMILADGGRVPLTAANDQYTVHKWDEVGVEPDSVGKIRVQDMEVVDMGEPIKATGDCVRN